MGKLPPLWLTERQVIVMIKFYYMKSLVKVAKDENITANQIKTLLDNGFRAIRWAYGPLYRAGEYFDAETVFRNMADFSGFTYE